VAALESLRLNLFADMFADPPTSGPRWQTCSLVQHLDALIFGSGRWRGYAAPVGQLPISSAAILGRSTPATQPDI
jgi:hypothetical protein